MNKKFLTLIEEEKYTEARKSIIDLPAVDIAKLFEEVPQPKLVVVFRLLPKDLSSDVFTHMSSELQRQVIEAITDKEVVAIMSNLFMDDAIDFIEEMPANVVKRVLKNTSEDTRTLINQFLNYPTDSAGSIMTIEYIDLKKHMTVGQALDYIKANGYDKETINTCYVLNSSRVLEGVVSLRQLVLSDDEEILEDIINLEVDSVKTHDDQEEVATTFKKYDYYVMPVVDNENRLVGIITVDDIIDVIDKEATEDIHKMAALQPTEKPYLKTNIWHLAKNRIPWLLILMVSAALTGGIIKRYETALQSVILLAAFIPMLMDTGGNAGSQSSTLIIRGLALGEIEPKHFLKVIWKELGVSIIVGIILSAVNFLKIYLIDKAGVLVAITVSFTLVLTVTLSKVIGGILPLLAKRFKMDPAIMAGPLITTIVDAISLVVYFATATWLLKL
ncbi:MAG: magnesium transporter [Clostridiales bacterium]|nr:magnesium transporter [Clostridiales bacterium]